LLNATYRLVITVRGKVRSFSD